MIALTLVSAVLMGQEMPLLLWRTFDPFDEPGPMGKEQAMRLAKPEPRIAKYVDQIFELYGARPEEDPNRMVGAVRLALGYRGKWLFVDENGEGYIDRYGSFNANAWENLITTRPELTFLKPSYCLKFFIRNETPDTLRFSDLSGQRTGKIGPGKTVGFKTHFWTYKVYRDTKTLVSIFRFFHRPLLESNSVRISFSRFGPGWSNMTSQSPAARLVIRPK